MAQQPWSILAQGKGDRTAPDQNVPCGGSPGRRSSTHSPPPQQFLHGYQRLPHGQGKAEPGHEMSLPCCFGPSHLGQQVSLAGGTDERTVGYDTNPSFMPLHQAVLVPWHISQSAEGLPRVSRAALPQLWEEQPPQGASKQGANTDQQKGFV